MDGSSDRDSVGKNRQTYWRKHPNNPVLTIGAKGEWDAGALGTMSVVKVADVFHMYYEAWGRRSSATWDEEEYFTLQIGHAVSPDGTHWSKDPSNSVLPRGKDGEWDHHGTWDPFVLYEDNLFKIEPWSCLRPVPHEDACQ